MKRPVPIERILPWLSSHFGLSSADVLVQRKHYGLNDILETPRNPILDLALGTAKDPMIWFLVIVGAIYLVLGSTMEGIILFASIFPLIGMDAYLHRRTQASTAGLKSRLASKACVLREGVEIEIDITEVVPGDLAKIKTGEPFPADGLLIQGEELQVDESALTGESFPVRKHLLPELNADQSIAIVEDSHWGFAGTRLLTGQALLRVVFTGQETLYGEIIQSTARLIKERTPLQLAISKLVSYLVYFSVFLCIVLAAVRLKQGFGWIDALVSAATLAVAALPEEFPVVFTVFLGVGVYRLAKRKVLVRRAVSVENMGRVSCICSDKTGTITEGQLDLAHLIPVPGLTEKDLLVSAALASRQQSNDPLDIAILGEVNKQSIALDQHAVIASYPFTEDQRREISVTQVLQKDFMVSLKGAPETVLDMCKLSSQEREVWLERMQKIAQDGHKVIACATQMLEVWNEIEPVKNYTFIGFLAFEDPVRVGVKEAVEACRKAGIHVLMLTGDHPGTAAAVAKDIGLGMENLNIILGDELEAILTKSPINLRTIDVVARAMPAQKLAIVKALQAQGEIVAVTGDGVNDVPALQAADVGIAMGERATRSAREVAAIVLLNDSFNTIVSAIAEGRQLFKNIQASFEYLLIIHIPLVLTATFIPLLGYPILYLPIHIVWLEAIIHPTAILVFQNSPTSEQLLPIAKSRDIQFFSPLHWLMILMTGILIAGAIFFMYYFAFGQGHDVNHARSTALMILVLTSASVTVKLSGFRTRVSKVVSLASVFSVLFLISFPTIADLIHLSPLSIKDWCIGVLSVVGGVAVPHYLKVFIKEKLVKV